jgi:alpha-maltose-1-phosphate synthase
MKPRVLFVNGGILGLLTFHQFLERMLPTQSAIDWAPIVLTEGLTLRARAVRRLLGTRAWKDGLFGVANLDLARFRLELFAGLLARHRITSAGRCDVLHFHRQATAYGSLDLMRRVPSIVSIDCTQDCVIAPAGRLERKTYRPNLLMDGAIFRRAAVLVAASRWAADSLRDYYPDCRTPIHVLPTPVLTHLFEAAWIEQRRARAAQGAKPRVLFVGGDFPRKGGRDLLAAWQAGGFHARATLDLVTDWPLADPLPPGVVKHSGIRSHTPEWTERWAAADVFVLPTRNDARPNALQEAAAAGLPAIATRITALPEMVTHGETGLLVPAGDTAAIAEALERLIASPALRDALGRRARAFILDVASPDRYLSTLIDIVLTVAKTR